MRPFQSSNQNSQNSAPNAYNSPFISKPNTQTVTIQICRLILPSRKHQSLVMAKVPQYSLSPLSKGFLLFNLLPLSLKEHRREAKQLGKKSAI